MKSSTAAGQRRRQQICREAARLMAEEGVTDHQSAKLKAIERLGLTENSALPDNREIELALSEYLELFQVAELNERKIRWRKTALEAMQMLQPFSPQLTGPVLSGIITRYSCVQVLVLAPPETISILLLDEQIPNDQQLKRWRRSNREYVNLPAFRFVVDNIPVEIICVLSDEYRRTLRCPISGKPISRANTDEVRRLINKTLSMSLPPD